MLKRPFFWIIIAVTAGFALLPLATGNATLRESLILMA